MTRPYPIGRQDFQAIIEGGFAYVDKTRRMYEMVKNRAFVFLSRPRRFGKSLLVNMLQCYFEAKKDLFANLEIGQLEKEWIAYPVLRFDMSGCKDMDSQGMTEYIGMLLREYEKIYGINSTEKKNGNRLQNIIKTAHTKKGRKVVVLIDEYDSPLLTHLHDGKLEETKTSYKSSINN